MQPGALPQAKIEAAPSALEKGNSNQRSAIGITLNPYVADVPSAESRCHDEVRLRRAGIDLLIRLRVILLQLLDEWKILNIEERDVENHADDNRGAHALHYLEHSGV